MKYLLLILADLCIAGQFTCNKLYEKNLSGKNSSLLLFPVISALFNILFFFIINKFNLHYGTFTFTMAVINALLQVTSVILGIIAVKFGSVSIYTVFMMLGGMLLAYFYGIIFLDEEIKIWQVIGLCLLIFALILSIEIGNEKHDRKHHIIFYILCVLVFFINGGTSIVGKVHQINPYALPTIDYVVWNYTCQFVLGLLLFFISFLFKSKKENGRTTETFSVNSVIFAIGFGLCNGLGYLLLLITTKNMPATVLYPFVTGLSIILTTIFARIIFKEKISKNVLISLLIIFVGTIMFTF